MKSILIHPSSPAELSLLETILKKMSVSFEKIENEKETVILSDCEKKMVMEGFKDVKEGKVHTKEQAHELVEQCFK